MGPEPVDLVRVVTVVTIVVTNTPADSCQPTPTHDDAPMIIGLTLILLSLHLTLFYSASQLTTACFRLINPTLPALSCLASFPPTAPLITTQPDGWLAEDRALPLSLSSETHPHPRLPSAPLLLLLTLPAPTPIALPMPQP